MSFLQRVSILSFIILLCVSIYKDLSKDIYFLSEVPNNPTVAQLSNQFSTIKVKVEQGETLLSIVENINRNNTDQLDIQKIMTDFININPQVDPYNLNVGAYYYFPLYDH